MVARSKVERKIKIKDATKGEVPKASCLLSIGKALSKIFGTYISKIDFYPFTF